MNFDWAKELTELKSGSFETGLCNEIHANLINQMNLFLSVHWFNAFLDKYPNPVPASEYCAFGMSFEGPRAAQWVFGINQYNVKERVNSAIHWATPMVITAIVSETEYLLSSIKEIRATGRKSNENIYMTTEKCLTQSLIWDSPEFTEPKDRVLLSLSILSDLNNQRNGVVHRLDKDGRKKDFVIAPSNIADAWLQAAYILVVIDGLLARAVLHEVS